MTASARVLRLLQRQLTTPLRLALASAPSSRAAARGYFSFSILQQPHRCWARAAAAAATAPSATSSSSCEQNPQAGPIAAAPGATCPHEGKGDGEAVRGGEKAAGAQAQQDDDSSGAGAPSLPAPKDKEALRAAATTAGRKGRSGASSPRQRGRAAKPQVNKPSRPGPPKQGRGGGGGIIHDVPRSSSSSASSALPSSSSTSSTLVSILWATKNFKKQENEDSK